MRAWNRMVLLVVTVLVLVTLRSAESLHEPKNENQHMPQSPVNTDVIISNLQERRYASTLVHNGTEGHGNNSTSFNETVTIVTEPLELIMAINQSDPYIEVRSHMNLTGLQAPEGETHVLGIIPEGVVSIQGNCSEPFPWSVNLTGASMLPMKRNQCGILTDAPLMKVSRSELWLDNLYIRRQNSRRGSWGAIVQEVEGRWFLWQDTVRMWMTNITMQADGDGEAECHVCAIDQSSGQLYAEDCTFSEFKGSQVAAFGAGQTSASLVNCTFANNTVVPNAFFDGNHAVIEGRKHMLSDGFAAAEVLVRLEGTNITNCTAEHHLVATGGTRIATDVFYSDQELTVFMPEIRANTTTTGTLTQAPDEFLRSNDTFIVELKEELSGLPRADFKKHNPGDHPGRPGSKDPYPLSDRGIVILLIIYSTLGLALLWACCGFAPRFCPRQPCHCPRRRTSGAAHADNARLPPSRSAHRPSQQGPPAVPSTSRGIIPNDAQSGRRISYSDTQQRTQASANSRPPRTSAQGTASPKDDWVHVNRTDAQSVDAPNPATASKSQHATLTRSDTPRTPESPKRQPKPGPPTAPSPAAPPNPTTLPPFVTNSAPAAHAQQTTSGRTQRIPSDTRGSVPPNSTAKPTARDPSRQPAAATSPGYSPNASKERENGIRTAAPPHTAATMPPSSHTQHVGQVRSSAPIGHSQTAPRPAQPPPSTNVSPSTGGTYAPSSRGAGDATRISSHAAYPGTQGSPGSGRGRNGSPQAPGQHPYRNPSDSRQDRPGNGREEPPVAYYSPREGTRTGMSPLSRQAYAPPHQAQAQYQGSDRSQAQTQAQRPHEAPSQPGSHLQRSSVPQGSLSSRVPQAHDRRGNVARMEDLDEDYTDDSSSSEEYDYRASRRGAGTAKRFLGMKLPNFSLTSGLAAAREIVRRPASASPQRRNHRSPDQGENRSSSRQYEGEDRQTRSRSSRPSNQYSQVPPHLMPQSYTPDLAKPLNPGLQPPVFPNVTLQPGDDLRSHHPGTSAYDARYPTQPTYDQQDRRPRSGSAYIGRKSSQQSDDVASLLNQLENPPQRYRKR